MDFITLSSNAPSARAHGQHIYCPNLHGLSARLADASFLMPRMDQNQAVKDNSGHGQWAATIAADPFGSNNAYFNALRTAGYKGITNWPSAILLEGQTQQQMSTIPATPKSEYSYLATAQSMGLQTMGFILTPDHAVDALEAGISTLVLHPGILLDVDYDGAKLIRSSLSAIIAAIKRQDGAAKIYIYTSDWHDQNFDLASLRCDGFVRFQETEA